MTWDREKSASGGIRNHSCSNLHTFVLEDLCWNLVTKVQEDLSFVLEDLCLNPEEFVLESESDYISARRFVLESARNSSRTLSIRAGRFVAESEHVGAGIL